MSEQEEVLKPLLGSVTPSTPEPVVEPAVEVVAPEPVVEPELTMPKSASQYATKPVETPKVSTEGDKIVFLSALKVNAYEGNSESVKTVQLKLRDLGFDSVMNDKYGRLGEGSVEAMNAFRKSKGLGEGGFDEEAMAHLFKGDSVGIQP